MAELVGAFGVPHMPNTPLNVRQNPTGELAQLFGAVRHHVDAIDPEALVVFDTDHFAVERMRDGEVDELLNAATRERLQKAGNVSGEILNWIALLGAVGERKPCLIEPQLDGGNAYAAWRWDR